jgi:hypothetical protein
MPATQESVDALLAELPAEKRRVISSVRDTINKKLPRGYEEIVQGR